MMLIIFEFGPTRKPYLQSVLKTPPSSVSHTPGAPLIGNCRPYPTTVPGWITTQALTDLSIVGELSCTGSAVAAAPRRAIVARAARGDHHPLPAEIWFAHVDDTKSQFAGNRAGQNGVSTEVALASLPLDPFTTFLTQTPAAIRVEGKQALPHANHSSIKQAEWTYGLMMHFSKSLGVNCTYCHNSRQFASWEESPPTRAKAWHGIQMVRDLNNDFLVPLRDVFPANRHGPSGDGPKLYCATCHQGVSKPLGGKSMLGDYSALAGPVVAAAASTSPTDTATPAQPASVESTE